MNHEILSSELNLQTSFSSHSLIHREWQDHPPYFAMPLSLLVPHAVTVIAGLPAVPVVVHSLDPVGSAEIVSYKDRLLEEMVSYSYLYLSTLSMLS